MKSLLLERTLSPRGSCVEFAMIQNLLKFSLETKPFCKDTQVGENVGCKDFILLFCLSCLVCRSLFKKLNQLVYSLKLHEFALRQRSFDLSWEDHCQKKIQSRQLCLLVWGLIMLPSSCIIGCLAVISGELLSLETLSGCIWYKE